MKRFLLLIFSIYFLLGCTTKIATTVDSMKIGEEKVAGISDVFFRYEKINGIKDITDRVYGDAFAYDLCIVSLTDDIVGLSYNEYSRMSPWVYGSDSWIIRSAFGNKYEYPVDKNIKFKDVEFKVTKKEDNSIRYQRIK